MSLFYDRLVEQAQLHDISLSELGKQAGITNIYAWKNMENPNPNMETLKKLSDVLQVSVEYLTGQNDNPTKNPASVDLLKIPSNNRDDWISAGGHAISDDDWSVIQALVKKYQE